VILAGNQGRSKENILTDLRSANLKSESINAIANHIDSPIPLDILLRDIKPEFALSLFVQCQKFAILDGVITPEESELLRMIEKKLEF
jgi:hypothetical protein